MHIYGMKRIASAMNGHISNMPVARHTHYPPIFATPLQASPCFDRQILTEKINVQRKI